MSSIELNDETFFRTDIPGNYREILAASQQISSLHKQDKSAQTCEEAEKIAQFIQSKRSVLLDKLPDYLHADTDYFKRGFARSVYMWLRFPYAAGRARYDSLGCKTHSLFPVDLTLSPQKWHLVDEALIKMGLSRKSLSQIKGGVEAQTSNLELKNIIADFVCSQLHDANDRHRMFQSMYGEIQVPAKMVDIIVTDAQLFFCLPYDENGLIEKEKYAWQEEHKQNFKHFIESLELNNPTARVFFPSVGEFHCDKVDREFLSTLTQHVRNSSSNYKNIDDEVVLDTLGTMIILMASQEIEKFLIHDAWGHAWQETLCDFEWFYEKMGQFKAPLNFLEASIYQLEAGPCMASCLSKDEGGELHFDKALFDKLVRADIKGRVSVALNACVAELTADITEYKFNNIAKAHKLDFPSSSHLDSQAVRLDLTFNDAKKHINSLRQPYLEFVSSTSASEAIAQQFIQRGFSREETAPILKQMAKHIEENFLPLLSDSIEQQANSETLHISILEKMHLNICSLYCALTGYIEKGKNKIGTTGDTASYPEASLDFIMIAIACFFEEDRFMNIWHMDEIIDGPLAETISAFGEAWRGIKQEI